METCHLTHLVEVVKVNVAPSRDGADIHNAPLHLVQQEGREQEWSQHVHCPCELKAIL